MANQQVLIRAIKLDNKPAEMLRASAKGSVPILVLPNNEKDQMTVLEESMDIMLWALRQDDPNNLLQQDNPQALPLMTSFIAHFEQTFIPVFEAFSCAKRYHNDDEQQRRQACEQYLNALEKRLTQHAYLFSENETLVDIALFPFIRKYAKVDKQRFRDGPYVHLRTWLNHYLQSSLFSKVMQQQELWLDNRKDCYFG